MSLAIVTGSAGLVGSESVRLLLSKGLEVVGVDNDMRRKFFGDEASTAWSRRELEKLMGYRHVEADIRDAEQIAAIFREYAKNISIVIHAAAQPSHELGRSDPRADFSINAQGTLNMLEAARQHASEATFIFTSTNKVYGDTPNRLPLIEGETRWELEARHPFHAHGIDESMTIDSSMHSIFGASKTAADVMTQEYGRYFGMKTACFRCGCLTGPAHSGARLHGFLSYLVRCAITGEPYSIYGYKGKQVRDNLHAADLAEMFWEYHLNSRPGEVYNAGGGRACSVSVLEAIDLIGELTGKRVNHTLSDEARAGDHIWWISDTRKFEGHYPNWKLRNGIREIIVEIYDRLSERVA